MDSARSIAFKFHMDLQKKLREVVADIIRGNFFLIVTDNLKKNFLTDAARSSVAVIALRMSPTIFQFFLQTLLDRLSLPRRQF